VSRIQNFVAKNVKNKMPETFPKEYNKIEHWKREKNIPSYVKNGERRQVTKIKENMVKAQV
jgi:hypothetical protein